MVQRGVGSCTYADGPTRSPADENYMKPGLSLEMDIGGHLTTGETATRSQNGDFRFRRGPPPVLLSGHLRP